MTKILGIDNGINGGIAFLEDTDAFRVMTMPTVTVNEKRKYNIPELVRIIGKERPNYAILEYAGAMPGQGVTSMFSFGESYGVIKGILVALNIPFAIVHPAKWTKVYGGGVKYTKVHGFEKAKSLFPNHDGEFLGKKGGLKDGRVDALLLAHYGRTIDKKLLGETYDR